MMNWEVYLITSKWRFSLKCIIIAGLFFFCCMLQTGMAEFLSVTPNGTLSSSGTIGGPFNPDSITYTLSNFSTSMDTVYSVTKTKSWVSLSSTGGTIPYGTSIVVTVSINNNANLLSTGSYSDTVVFTNLTTHIGDTTRAVNLSVYDPPVIKNKYYLDYDGDGYGNPNISTDASFQPSGYVTDKLDCNDDDSGIHPGAAEIRGDDIDQDCDGKEPILIPPVLRLPIDGSSDISLTHTLITEIFSDPDMGDTHLQTDWQISSSDDFTSSIIYSESKTHLTSLPLPVMVLRENTTYYWRARFWSHDLSVSEWSNIFSFTTLNSQNDTNGNGIPDVLENDTIDLDNDGIADIQQETMKSLNTVVGDGQMGISIKGSSTITEIIEIDSIDPDNISKIARPYEMPLGLFSFSLKVKNDGDPADVTIYFSETAPLNSVWYKYDPIKGWIDYSAHATFSQDRKSVTLELKDGDYGDADGVANGIIVDPCGFGIASWIKGFVSGSPLSEKITSAKIKFEDLNLTLNTLLDGNYLSMILPGIYDFSVSAPGYDSQTFSNLEIEEGSIVTKDIELSSNCKIKLSGVKITGENRANGEIKITATVSPEYIGNVYYRFGIIRDYGTRDYDPATWTKISEFSTLHFTTYKFTEPGSYIFTVTANCFPYEPELPKPMIGGCITILPSTATDCIDLLAIREVKISGKNKVNSPMHIEANAYNECGGNVYYRFGIIPNYGTDFYNISDWKPISEYTTNNSLSYIFTEAGSYIFTVTANDKPYEPEEPKPLNGGSITIFE